MAKVLESIPDEFAKKYIAGEIPQTKSFTVDMELVDICEGNIYQAIILSRIVFWHRPNVKGNSRLRVRKNGHLWIARNHNEWFEECRVKKSTARRALRILEEKQLICSDNFLFNNKITPHYRLNWEVFGKKLKAWSTGEDEIEVEQPAMREQSTCHEMAGKVLPDDTQGVTRGQARCHEWTAFPNLSAVIGQLDCHEMTGKVSPEGRQSVTRGQARCHERADSITRRQHVDTCNTQEKEITSTKLSPVGDKSEKQNALVEEESEMAEPEITPDAQTSEPDVAPEDQKPESESDTEKVISEDEWIADRKAMVKAIAYTFDLQESYTGFPAMLRTQLEGTAKKGKRKEFALEDPATPSEVWGFGAWYKKRDLEAPTSSELLYERFEEFRSLNQYHKFQMIGEYTLREKYREAHQAPEMLEETVSEEALEAFNQRHKAFLAKAEELNRRLTNPRSDAERIATLKEIRERRRQESETESL